MEEPNAPTPHPCSTPHSAPVAWPKYDPGIAPPPEAGAEEPPSQPDAHVLSEVEPLTPDQQRRHDIKTFLAAYERIAPQQERRDGWTPFLRKFFLQVIAEGGGVGAACEYTGMSRSSAYALEARDRVFAAGWAAASHFARNPMADDFYEKSRNGITETITRGDGVTVTRHRFDSRLSIAVLNRLDRRCDRAEERGSVHLAAVRNWDEYLRLVGEGDDKAAEALLDTPQDCTTCPLPERANPIPAPDPPGCDPSENCWKDEDGRWMTTFPPPPGFDGYQNIPWDGDNWYERACTPEEAELLDAHQAAAEAEETAQVTAFAEAQRDGYFAKLRAELNAAPHRHSRERGNPARPAKPFVIPANAGTQLDLPNPSPFPRTREPS